jgi:hypothetical protein
MTSADDATREPTPVKPATGKAVLHALDAEGLIGLWRDRPEAADGSAYARQLRVAAETRQ